MRWHGTSEVQQILGHVMGSQRADAALARRLQAVVGGNPFYLLEILRERMASEKPLDAPGQWEEAWPLPDTIREAVSARLDRLTPQARQVLEAGAVLGLSFQFEVVQQVAGRSEMETMDGLDELVDQQVVLEQAGTFRFQHELVRTAVYQGLSPGRRQLLHRRAGEALEKGLSWTWQLGGGALNGRGQAGIRPSRISCRLEIRAGGHAHEEAIGTMKIDLVLTSSLHNM